MVLVRSPTCIPIGLAFKRSAGVQVLRLPNIVAAMRPRGRDETIIRIVDCKRRKEAVDYTPRPERLPSCPIHGPCQDVVVGSVFGYEENRTFRPRSDGLG